MYVIGQILYAVLSKKNQIYPFQVVEIITKKTLEGEEVRYLLQGGPDKTISVYLDQVDGEIFDSLTDMAQSLTERANKQIRQLIKSAEQKSKEWYSVQKSVTQTIEDLPEFQTKQQEIQHENVSTTEVMLPDGTVAKVKLPAV